MTCLSPRQYRRKPASRLAKSLVAVLMVTFSVAAAHAAIRLPAIFNDNMVLQQQASDPVWGWADPGSTVRVLGSWPGSVAVSARADDAGKWELRVKTPAAGGPYTLRVEGTETIVLHNVMIGEVWVCSGQSNMEMPVSGWGGAPLLNSAREIQDASYPHIRLFTVARDIAMAPEQDCTGSWSECSPQTVGSFSATAYFFGRELYRKLKVPIGLIHSSWGGTVAEAWTSSEALRKLGGFDQKLDQIDSLRPHVKDMTAVYDQKLAVWNAASGKVNTDYEKPGYDDGDWKTMNLPGYWESQGYPDLDGVVWYRKEVELPASWAGKPLELDLGPIDDEDMTFFNGKKVGSIEKTGFYAQDRSYEIPAGVAQAGKNLISVRVTDISGNGGFHGKGEQMQLSEKGGHTPAVSLAGAWKFKIGPVKPVIPYGSNPNLPTVLYNGMIAPLIPFGIRGVIWYQGEANVGRAAQYEKLFPAMIRDWRSRWHEGDFPFYYVQIAPYPYGGDLSRAAALRDAQRRSLSTPNTGMVVTLDIGNPQNIHPANKQEVGRRLSLWALAHTYGEKSVICSGPLYKSLQIQGDKAVVSFENTQGGLVAKKGHLDWFEIAGQDGHFVPAHAVIQGNKVVVTATGVDHPTAVRFAWKDTAEPDLFNGAGLPASSFTSEPLR